MLAVDEDVNGVEMRARASVQRDLVHDLPVCARDMSVRVLDKPIARRTNRRSGCRSGRPPSLGTSMRGAFGGGR